MRKQKNSRPAGTGATVNAKPKKILHKKYNTTLRVFQVFFQFLCLVVLLVFTIRTIIELCDTTELEPIQHKVSYGDTLWNLALEYKPESMTMNEYMSWVYEYNDMNDTIFPGDVIIMGVEK